jgi:hypothetical protein
MGVRAEVENMSGHLNTTIDGYQGPDTFSTSALTPIYSGVKVTRHVLYLSPEVENMSGNLNTTIDGCQGWGRECVW